MNYFSPQKGFAALYLSLLVTAISAGIGASVFFIVSGQQTEIRSFLNSGQAYYTAEAGVEDAVYRVKNLLSYPSEYALNIGGKETQVVVVENGSIREVTSSGSYGNAAKNVRADVFASTAGADFQYAIQVGYLGLEMENQSQVIGTVYSHGSIEAEQNTQITGDAWVAGGTGADPNQEQIMQAEDLNVRDDSSRRDAAQSFTPSITSDARKVSLYIKKAGSPGNASIRIVEDNGGVPDRSGAYSSGTLQASAVTTTYNWVDVAMDSDDPLMQGQIYWIIIDNDGSSASSYYTVGGATDGSYAQGTFLYSANWNASSPVWTGPPQGSRDSAFRVFLGDATTKIAGATIGGNAHANTIEASNIAGDAYYQVISETSVGGIQYPGSQDPDPQNFPISSGQIADFKAEGDAGGVCGAAQGCQADGDYELDNYEDGSLGPIQISGDLDIENHGHLTITGTVHVLGDLDLKNNCVVDLDSSYGSRSGVIVVDGTVEVENQCDIYGSGDPASYLVIITTSAAVGAPPAMRVQNSAAGAIFYASEGELLLENQASVKEAVGQKLHLKNSATVTYESGLMGVNFSEAPGGSFQLIEWKEVE